MNIWIYWVIIIVILAIIEVLTLKFKVNDFIISAIICLIISLYNNCFILQFVLFIIFGFILLFVNKIIIDKHNNIRIDKYIGKQAIVTKGCNKNTIGEVVINGKLFAVLSAKRIKKGENVKLLRIEESKLVVERIKKTH